MSLYLYCQPSFTFCCCRCLLLAVPGMLEYDSIPGVSSSKPFGGGSKAHADITVKSVTKMVGDVGLMSIIKIAPHLFRPFYYSAL